LKILAEQLAAFRRGLGGDLETRALRHVQRRLPGWVTGQDSAPPTLADMRRCIAFGRRHGLESDAALLFYACVGVVFGAELKEDATGALRQTLEDPRHDEGTKVAAMKELLRGFVARTGGP
jgi:hypothetical protein